VSGEGTIVPGLGSWGTGDEQNYKTTPKKTKKTHAILREKPQHERGYRKNYSHGDKKTPTRGLV